MAFTDRDLICRDCGAGFPFTAGEQEFYATKGLDDDPVRCPTCRAQWKLRKLMPPEDRDFGVYASWGRRRLSEEYDLGRGWHGFDMGRSSDVLLQRYLTEIETPNDSPARPSDLDQAAIEIAWCVSIRGALPLVARRRHGLARWVPPDVEAYAKFVRNQDEPLLGDLMGIWGKLDETGLAAASRHLELKERRRTDHRFAREAVVFDLIHNNKNSILGTILEGNQWGWEPLPQPDDPTARAALRELQAQLSEPAVGHSASRHIPTEVKQEVWGRDRGACVACGASGAGAELEFDHVIPHILGGSNGADNIQLLCRNCNRAKGAAIE